MIITSKIYEPHCKDFIIKGFVAVFVTDCSVIPAVDDTLDKYSALRLRTSATEFEQLIIRIVYGAGGVRVKNVAKSLEAEHKTFVIAGGDPANPAP